MRNKDKTLSEALTYWKGYAIAREKDLVAAHKEIVQLRNDVENQRKLRIEDKKQINRLYDQIRDLQLSKGNS